jgi:hypothetical protein
MAIVMINVAVMSVAKMAVVDGIGSGIDRSAAMKDR